MTEAIYIETYVAQSERRISVSGVLRYLGVSRNGFLRWLNRKPSRQAIHNKSHQNYGASKIAVILKREGNIISERTVGQYMRESGIKAQYIKPWVQTTRDSDYSKSLKKYFK